ncbi:MAG: hypothetical protein WD969_05610 [Paracoccaceae bacterium]
MAENKGEDGRAERAERLAAALRRNLRQRKSQAKSREDLSGLDPNRKDTPLNRPNLPEKGDGG